MNKHDVYTCGRGRALHIPASYYTATTTPLHRVKGWQWFRADRRTYCRLPLLLHLHLHLTARLASHCHYRAPPPGPLQEGRCLPAPEGGTLCLTTRT